MAGWQWMTVCVCMCVCVCVCAYVCVCTVYIYLHCVYLSTYLSGCARDVFLSYSQTIFAFHRKIRLAICLFCFGLDLWECWWINTNLTHDVTKEYRTQLNVQWTWQYNNITILFAGHEIEIPSNSVNQNDFSSPWAEYKVWSRKTRPETCLFCTAADSTYHQQARCVYTMCLF